MAYRLLILQTAAEDTAEAYSYYEGLQPGLDDRFLAEVLERYYEISKHPQYYGFIDEEGIMRCYIKKFHLFSSV